MRVIFASETVALDVVGATFVRSIEPGELVIVKGWRVRSHRPFAQPSRARASSSMSISRAPIRSRQPQVYTACARRSARSWRSRARSMPTYVIPVPDSGTPAAIGYAQASGIPFELGIIRSHYVGRTFIQPADDIRHLGVKLKHNANRALIEGKRIVLIDDSIVRGTTSLKIVQMMRDAGATEVHMRIASPPTRHSCFYGVDTPERAKLLAARMTVAEMATYIQADSLAFVSVDGLYKRAGRGERSRDAAMPSHCDACFTGDYPTMLTDHDDVAVRSVRAARRARAG
jgi:amidophosphoribosyltransferase